MTSPDVESMSADGPATPPSKEVLAALLRVAVDDGVPQDSALLALRAVDGRLNVLQGLVDSCCLELGGADGAAAMALLQLGYARPGRAEVDERRKTFTNELGRRRYSLDREREICDQVAACLARRLGPAAETNDADPVRVESGDAELVDEAPRRSTRTTRFVKTLWASLGINVLALVGTVTGVIGVLPDPPRQLNGEVNVAVLRSGASDADQQDQLETLAATVAQRLETRATDGSRQFSLGVIGPAEVEPVDLGGVDLDETLSEVARRHEADLVVLMTPGEEEFTVAIEVYVAARAVEGAEELAGRYEFGRDVLLGSSSRAAAGGAVRERITSRTGSLIDFIDGLGGFQRREFDYARVAFERTIAEADSGDSAILAIAHLFLGNTISEIAARVGGTNENLLADARSSYEAGLMSDASSARLRLGLLQNRYLSAQGGCRPATIDAAELTLVAADLRGLRAGLIGPETTLARIDLTIGRTQLCLLLAGVDGEETSVEAALKGVLELAESGGRVLQEIAAEAHMDLGLLLTSGTPTASALAAAEEHYLDARDLAVDPFRRSIAAFQAGLLAAQAGRLDQASQLLAEAAQAADDAAYPTLASEARRILLELKD